MSSQCEGLVLLCQLWGPAEPFALCQDGGSSLSWVSWAVKANNALGAQVWASGPTGPLGRAGGPYWSTGHPVSLLGFDASSGQAWAPAPFGDFALPLLSLLPSSILPENHAKQTFLRVTRDLHAVPWSVPWCPLT